MYNNNKYMAVHILKHIQDPRGYYSVCELLDHNHVSFPQQMR